MRLNKIIVYLCAFCLLIFSVVAVDLNILCEPAELYPGETTVCTLGLSEQVNSISSIDLTVNTDDLFSLASVTNVPNQFTALPNLNTGQVLISTPQLGLNPTNLGALNLLAGDQTGQVQVTLDDFEILDDNFGQIDITVNPSNSITIQPAGEGAECGDSVLEGEEACDGNNQVCTIGGYAGTQSCKDDCTDYNTCVTTESCGDGTINGLEQCDRSSLGGKDCTNYIQGSTFTGGTLSCMDCNFNLDACIIEDNGGDQQNTVDAGNPAMQTLLTCVRNAITSNGTFFTRVSAIASCLRENNDLLG